MRAESITEDVAVQIAHDDAESWQSLNAKLAFSDFDGRYDFDAERKAVKSFFVDQINTQMQFFHNQDERLDYLLTRGYYDPAVFNQYSQEDTQAFYAKAYKEKFRFTSLCGAVKFFTNYAMMTDDGKRYLERFEDRVVAVAMELAAGDVALCHDYIDIMMLRAYQPATPTFANAAKMKGGDRVSCYLLHIQDNIESIERTVATVALLSKRGGGVAVCGTDLRAKGAPIKGVANRCSGVIPVAKQVECAANYANQLGTRDGAAVFVNHMNHMDTPDLIDTKRENADDSVRLKSLSIGIVVPDIAFKLAAQDKDMYLFCPYDIMRVYGVPMSRLGITKYYKDLVVNPKIRKRKVNARRYFQTISFIQGQAGYPFIMFEDTVNRMNALPGYISMSNLCVAPETLLLTKDGEFPIKDLVGQHVEVWNGTEWSGTKVVKTGINQKLLKVKLSDGRSLECTPYHKWYLQIGNGPRAYVLQKRTHELEPGDRIIRQSFALIEGDQVLEHAYRNGFYSGDGTQLQNGQGRIYLYGEKMALKEILDPTREWRTGGGVQTRLELEFKDLKPKYFVPGPEYTVESRIAWLAGWIDADGTAARTEGLETIQIGSVHREFLREAQSMLCMLGINVKVTKSTDARMSMLPKNDGTGEYKEYPTKEAHRLLISAGDVQRLLEMGLELNRVNITPRSGTSSRLRHAVVTSVTDEGRTDDTYCVNEPINHMATFNGILTGQCHEIAQPSHDSTFSPDMSFLSVGKDISCNLGSLNTQVCIEHGARFPWVVNRSIRMLTQVSVTSHVECAPAINRGNQLGHAIGLGVMNLHGALAHYGIHYGSPESVEFTDLFYATMRYHAISASCDIAKEKGETFDTFKSSKYCRQGDESVAEVFRPYIDRTWEIEHDIVRDVFEDNGFYVPGSDDWAELEDRVQRHGMFNQNLLATAPTGSISYVNNATASIAPIVDKIESRKEGLLGRVYYPAPHMTNDNMAYFTDAYELGWKAVVDVYAAAAPHVDQSLSCTLYFLESQTTTAEMDEARIYAWKKGLKTLYYMRVRSDATDEFAAANQNIKECEACAV